MAAGSPMLRAAASMSAAATTTRHTALAVARRRVMRVAAAVRPTAAAARFVSTQPAAGDEELPAITILDRHLARPVITPQQAAASNPVAPSGPVEFTPKVARTAPWTIQLQPGKVYKWCSCGHSRAQPWCDKRCFDLVTPYMPVSFVANRNATVKVCGCKHTTTAPLCSGEHVRMRGLKYKTWGMRALLIGGALLGSVTVLGLVDKWLQSTTPGANAAVIGGGSGGSAAPPAGAASTVAAAASAAQPRR